MTASPSADRREDHRARAGQDLWPPVAAFVEMHIQLVTVSGAPPSADTRSNAERKLGANTIRLSSPQLAPRLAFARASACGAPPSTETFLSSPPAKNPSQAESGEKNGYDAPPNSARGAPFRVRHPVQ